MLAKPLAAEAQQATRLPRVGFLANSRSPGTEAFQKGLRDLGYVEGQNIVVDWRLAEGNLQRLPQLASELVAMRVDVIVAPAPPYVEAARRVTTTIPIIFTFVPDPVKMGLAASLARPGGNITGLVHNPVELHGKRVELLKEAVPGLVRLAVFTTGIDEEVRQVQDAAAAFGIEHDVVIVTRPDEISQSFAPMKAKGIGAVVEMSRPMIYAHRQRVADLAIQSGLPMICSAKENVEAGCLLYYGANFGDLMRRSAHYVDKILKGAKPGDLPIEQPTTFELVINLKTAKALGLTIPPSLVARADQVIE
jgi:putative tryptophan/tyrosine transport system substrate-binding protein